mmetsp:Transcript_44276/g.90382  ORF Transcript_44276/g.90382 Transcript_44276/m.90382 type:complete len:93 (+) Transcript_44276:187-465(+)|eukprot:CAMPEP_0181311188 /NCGR_PEP_ID=MMETSP1101-20121128/12999_1 /TAXON_ID=46948 /ORGANISM="Rhodomonas abbreviata, Strain Caron Lab Isolate" /LENGTH=92 /DNA_ID=CAMNT_0023417893 /DNA_START=182 /DNA_END=460 /DNA_ORIENTATION=-
MVPWIKTVQAWQHITMFGIIPGTLFFTRKYWAGESTTTEAELKEQYRYADDMVKTNKQALQELLDSAKKGVPGGHQAGQSWFEPVDYSPPKK